MPVELVNPSTYAVWNLFEASVEAIFSEPELQPFEKRGT